MNWQTKEYIKSHHEKLVASFPRPISVLFRHLEGSSCCHEQNQSRAGAIVRLQSITPKISVVSVILRVYARCLGTVSRAALQFSAYILSFQATDPSFGITAHYTTHFKKARSHSGLPNFKCSALEHSTLLENICLYTPVLLGQNCKISKFSSSTVVSIIIFLNVSEINYST